MVQENNDYREEWERRAKVHKEDCRGVLYGGLPAELNAAIGTWHAALVEKYIVPELAHGASVLDIAAGYGRLSMHVASERSDVTLVGIDLSFTYNQLYARNVGAAVCGDMRYLPFREQAFDRIIAVTGLMYLGRSECEPVVQQILARLKPGGTALFVDPGAEMIRVLRQIRPSLAKATTGGEGFAAADYSELFASAGNCTIVAKGGNTLFTCMLPFLLAFRNRAGIVSRLARWVVSLDLMFGGWSRLALHRWVVVRREA